MGQGQEVHARKLINNYIQNGGWVLLQNCHLSLDYVEEVMDVVVETETLHDQFRIWMTTEVHPKFPITFLQVRIVTRFIHNWSGLTFINLSLKMNSNAKIAFKI